MMQKESLILDAPSLRDDFYMNAMDWGSSNMLAVALGSALYTWNPCNRATHKLLDVDSQSDFPTSLAWSGDARKIAVGYMCSDIQLWDAETSKLVCVAPYNCDYDRKKFIDIEDVVVFLAQVRRLRGHQNRVLSVEWNGHILTSGSHDEAIINHDGTTQTKSCHL